VIHWPPLDMTLISELLEPLADARLARRCGSFPGTIAKEFRSRFDALAIPIADDHVRDLRSLMLACRRTWQSS
jgi:hypothetical protein